MHLPSLTTPEGLFDYLITAIVLLAALLLVYFAGVWLGVFPPPDQWSGPRVTPGTVAALAPV